MMAVYFAQAGDGGPIKIGYASASLSRRIAALKTACPAELRALGYIDGDRERERGLHRQFAGDRLTGEWFAPSPQLLALIADASPIHVRRRASPTIELIDALGGNAEVARIAGVGASAVSNWRKFGFIPPRLYLRVAAAGRERGIDVPEHLFREVKAA